MPVRSQSLVASLAVLASTLVLAACGAQDRSSGAAGPTDGAARASPYALSELRDQAGQLLDGGPKAFTARLGRLRGHPVVVTQWASWCGPCRYEFPFFAREAAKLNGRVAFLGVNSQDGRDNARTFLREHPVPYPHYFDPDASVARVFRGGRAFPTTAFYAASGRLVYTHVGAYASEAKLAGEIQRYAVDG